MKLFEIKSFLSGRILFSVETESMKLCLEMAVKSRAYLQDADLRGAYLQGADLRGAYLQGADLRGAYLQGAYLQGADLRGAYLQGADLRGAYLQGADLHGGIKITKEPIQISGLYWLVTIWDAHMQIGCEFHSHQDWANFSDEKWMEMGGKQALKLKREHLITLMALCESHQVKKVPEVT